MQIVWAGKVISVRWLLVRVVQIFWAVQMLLGGKGDPCELVAGLGGTDCSGSADGWGWAGGSGAVVGGLGDSGAVLGGLGGGIYAGSPNSD